jgi:hypothetical protein
MMHDPKVAMAARVKARNNANAEANRLYEVLAAIFAPLVGQKILKVDGQLLAKYAGLLPEFPSTNTLHVYRHSSDYSLAWCAKTCEFIPPHGCCYEEAMVYVADLSGTSLAETLCGNPEYRTDYTVEELVELRRIFKEKEKEFQTARSNLHPFGEHDR